MDRRIPISNQTIASGNATLRVAWGVGNSLVAFSAPTNTRKNTESSTKITKRGELHSVAFEQSLYTPIFRKLVNESAQTFSLNFHFEFIKPSDANLLVQFSS